GFPVVTDDDRLIGVVTRRDVFDADSDGLQVGDAVKRPPVVAYSHWPLREAADEMVRQHVGRLPVVDSARPAVVVGILSRSDLLRAHGGRLTELHAREEPLVRGRPW